MESIELKLHTFLTSAPDTVEPSTEHSIEEVGLEPHTFLTSAPDTVQRSTAHLMEAV